MPGEVDRAVEEALNVGYRLCDCALVYQNEACIGNVLRKAIDAGEVIREELFITSKVKCILANSYAKMIQMNDSRRSS